MSGLSVMPTIILQQRIVWWQSRMWWTICLPLSEFVRKQWIRGEISVRNLLGGRMRKNDNLLSLVCPDSGPISWWIFSFVGARHFFLLATARIFSLYKYGCPWCYVTVATTAMSLISWIALSITLACYPYLQLVLAHFKLRLETVTNFWSCWLCDFFFLVARLWNKWQRNFFPGFCFAVVTALTQPPALP